jgi:hypothetical protein
MRHRPHALRHDLRHLARPLGRLKRNVTFIAVSLLVPLVGLGALAVPPRILQGVAAPLWNATASPLAELVTEPVSRPQGSAAAPPLQSDRKRVARVAAGNLVAAGGVVSSPRQASRDVEADRPIGEPSKSEPPATGSGVTEGDNEAATDTVPSGGDAGPTGNARDDERARPVKDKSERGAGAGSGSGSDANRPALTTRPGAKTAGTAKATAAQARAGITETTAKLAAPAESAGRERPGNTKEAVAAVVAVATAEAQLPRGVLQPGKAGEP